MDYNLDEYDLEEIECFYDIHIKDLIHENKLLKKALENQAKAVRDICYDSGDCSVAWSRIYEDWIEEAEEQIKSGKTS